MSPTERNKLNIICAISELVQEELVGCILLNEADYLWAFPDVRSFGAIPLNDGVADFRIYTCTDLVYIVTLRIYLSHYPHSYYPYSGNGIELKYPMINCSVRSQYEWDNGSITHGSTIVVGHVDMGTAFGHCYNTNYSDSNTKAYNTGFAIIEEDGPYRMANFILKAVSNDLFHFLADRSRLSKPPKGTRISDRARNSPKA